MVKNIQINYIFIEIVKELKLLVTLYVFLSRAFWLLARLDI